MKVFDEILEIIKQNGITLAKVAKDSGIRYDRMAQWKIGKGNPKADDEGKLQDWLRNYKNVDNSISEEKDLNLVHELVASNRLLAEANNTYALANLKLATNMERLTEMVQNFSSHALVGSQIASATTKAEILELLSALRLKDGKAHSLEEAAAEVHKLISESEKRTSKVSK